MDSAPQTHKQNHPKVSVVIPAYNSEQTICETIESVLNQTFSDFEVIVVNDGSQDDTVAVVKTINDSRVRLIDYPNAGAAASRNRGAEQARGELLAFLDADDLWTPDKLEAQVAALDKNPQASVAYSWTDFIDANSQFLWPGLHISESGYVLERLLVVNFIENGSNTLIRKEAFRRVGGFDDSFESSEDWELWLRLAADHQFIAIPAPQILYRRTSTSKSANLQEHEAAARQTIEMAFARAPADLQHLKPSSLAHLYKYLTSRVTFGPPTRQRGILTLKYLGRAIKYQPSPRFRHRRFILVNLFKGLIMTVFPARLAEVILTKTRRLVKSN